jgi:type I restriction enzyme S subunit
MDGEFRAYLWGGADAWLNQRVCVFVPKPGISSAFVRNSIFAPLAHIEATEIATTVVHLGKNDIDRFQIIVPDSRLIQEFGSLCQPMYDQIVANKKLSYTLATTRAFLLPKLMSGEVHVKDAEKLVGEIA